MGNFFFVPLGVGDAFTAIRYTCCIALHADGHRLLLECPHPIRKMMREAGDASGVPMDIGDFDGVLLTHLHADHCCGLEGFAYYCFFLLDKRVRLFAHEDVLARIWDDHLSASMDADLWLPDGSQQEATFETFFDATALAEGEPVQHGPFTIECRRTIHPVPTTGFRIHAGGRSLGISGDTAWDPELVDWLSEADRVIHETAYGIHTPYEKLAALPDAIRQRMWLTHYPDDFDLEASVIEPLYEGRVYEV